MRLGIKLERTILLLKQRNFAYGVVFFLMVSQSFLILNLFLQTDRIVVVPHMNEPEKQYKLEGSHLPDEYYVDWASRLLSDIWTANPHTVDRKVETFLRWTVHSFACGEELKRTKDLLKKEQISTAFYPTRFLLEKSKRRIHVSGVFLSYFGKSTTPITSEKKFILTWKMAPEGFLLIESLEEVKEGGKDEKKKG